MKRHSQRIAKRLAGKVAAKEASTASDCSAAKMDAWQWAIDEAGASLFLDADIKLQFQT